MNLIFRLAYRNVKSHWRQSLAALVSVITGFVAFSLFDGYMRDVYRGLREQDENIQLNADLILERKNASAPEGRNLPWNWALTGDEQKKISSYLDSLPDQVYAYSRFLRIDGSIDTSNASFVFMGFGYDVKGGSLIHGRWKWNTYWGQPLIQLPDPKHHMLMGRRLGQFLGCLPDQLDNIKKYLLDLEFHPMNRPFLCENQTFQLSSVTEKGQVNAIDMNVAGLYDHGFKEFDERLVVLPLEAAQSLFDTDKVNYYSIRLQKDVDKVAFIQQFQKHFAQHTPALDIQQWDLHPFFGDTYRKTINLLDTDRAFVISIIIFVGCLSVFNTLIKIINERTFEIGMFRSLGFSPDFIRKLFILEAVLLSWLGSFFGIILSIVLAHVINGMEITYASGLFSFESPLRIKISPYTYLYGIFMMSALSYVAAYIAVRKPSRMVIAQTLIHV